MAQKSCLCSVCERIIITEALWKWKIRAVYWHIAAVSAYGKWQCFGNSQPRACCLLNNGAIAYWFQFIAVENLIPAVGWGFIYLSSLRKWRFRQNHEPTKLENRFDRLFDVYKVRVFYDCLKIGGRWERVTETDDSLTSLCAMGNVKAIERLLISDALMSGVSR